jgi:hypothetical protein
MSTGEPVPVQRQGALRRVYMELGNLVLINDIKHRILQDGAFNFCLNNLEKGGCIRFYGWKLNNLAALNCDLLKRLIIGDIAGGRTNAPTELVGALSNIK